MLQRERGQFRKAAGPGDSEPLSSLLGRLEIQGGCKDNAALSTAGW